MQTHWDMSGRDVIPDVSPGAAPRDVGAAALLGMLMADGTAWTSPYDGVRAAMGIRQKTVLPELQEQADQRLRTFKALFRGVGLLYDENQTLRRTEVGGELLTLLQEQLVAVDDYGRRISLASKRRLAELVAPTLARYELASPLSQSVYPPDTDIRPLLAIWRAMRSLENKLHWEELGRVLTGCLREADLGDAIETIRVGRAAEGYSPSDESMMDRIYGPRHPAGQGAMADRLDVWFSRAAFKDIFLEARDRPDRYRYLKSDFIDIIDRQIVNPPSHFPGGDSSTYVRWLGSSTEASPDAPMSDDVVDSVVAKCRRWGDRQIIAFAGPAGTGKTRLAEKVAAVLVDGDDSRLNTVQFHAAYTYEEFVGGLGPKDGSFAPIKGILLQASAAAESDPGHNTHVLLIDELSRADVANVLGELLTYVEYRGRPFRVPTFEKVFTLAPNLIILATFNPSDRSVINIDDATIRRLRVVAVPPSVAALRAILSDAGMKPDLISQVCLWFSTLPDDVPFGHGLFVGARDEFDLHELWHESLQLYLRRGGVATYPSPELIEGGYVWRAQAYARALGAQLASDGVTEEPSGADSGDKAAEHVEAFSQSRDEGDAGTSS